MCAVGAAAAGWLPPPRTPHSDGPCSVGGRRTPGHPLQAFGSSAFDLYRRQIESFLVPCSQAKKDYFRPLAAARKTLLMLLRS